MGFFLQVWKSMFLPFLLDTPPKQQISIQNRFVWRRHLLQPKLSKAPLSPSHPAARTFPNPWKHWKKWHQTRKIIKCWFFPVFNGMLSVYFHTSFQRNQLWHCSNLKKKKTSGKWDGPKKQQSFGTFHSVPICLDGLNFRWVIQSWFYFGNKISGRFWDTSIFQFSSHQCVNLVLNLAAFFAVAFKMAQPQEFNQRLIHSGWSGGLHLWNQVFQILRNMRL